jgi:hypothetical protein
LRRGSAQALRDFGVIAASADQIDGVRIGVIVDMRQIDLNLACNDGAWEFWSAPVTVAPLAA